MQSDSLLIYFLLIPAFLSPIPFIYAFWKIMAHDKNLEGKLEKSNKNLCTLAEDYNLQNYIVYGFYLTGIFAFLGGILFSTYLGGSIIYFLFCLWMISGILFFLSGKSVFDHSGKTHNIASRLLIFFLVCSASLVSIQIIKSNFVYGLSLLLIIITSGFYIGARASKLKFIDRTAQISFHLAFSIWNWLVCVYIIALSI